MSPRSKAQNLKFLSNTGCFQNTAKDNCTEGVDESSMNNGIRMGNLRWEQEMGRQIIDSPFRNNIDAEISKTIVDGVTLDIAGGNNLEDFSSEIRNRLEREAGDWESIQ